MRVESIVMLKTPFQNHMTGERERERENKTTTTVYHFLNVNQLKARLCLELGFLELGQARYK